MADVPKFTVVRPSSDAQKATRTTLDTILVSPDIVSKWQNPPFQRPLRVNEKVKQVAELIKRDGGVIPGVITIGVLSGTKYILDGQHRREAFLISGCQEGYVDVRIHFFSSMGEMGEEFVNLNSHLVRLRPDDILRGLEESCTPLRTIREKCRFISYDQIRRGDRSPVLSMSTAIRTWMGSGSEVPSPSTYSAASLALSLTMEEVEPMVSFLNLCHEAWGRELAYGKLWGVLNLIVCAWLYRRLVITQYSPKTPKLTKEMFKKCLMSVSAKSDYLDWLVGRNLGERDRSPAYGRLKSIFASRLEEETGVKPKLPSPAWAHHM